MLWAFGGMNIGERASVQLAQGNSFVSIIFKEDFVGGRDKGCRGGVGSGAPESGGGGALEKWR